MSAAACVAAMLWVSPAHAIVRLTVSLDTTTAGVGEVVSVRYTVQLRDQSAVQIMPLNFGQLQLLSEGSPPQVPAMWGSGFGMQVDTANEYLVRGMRPGRYVISGGRAVDSRTQRVIAQAAPVTLIVGNAPPGQVFGGEDTPDGGAGDSATEIPVDPDAPPSGDLSGAFYDMVGFFRVGVDRPRVYLGEQVTYRAWAYASSAEASCDLTEEPTFPGFWNEAAFLPTRECAQRWFTQTVNGRFMSIGLVRKFSLFATQTGTARFGATVGHITVMSGGMFRSVQRAESRTPALELDVREPPAAGRPEGYVAGTIGPVTLEATADRPQCRTGETVTITVRAVSDGSLAAARFLVDTQRDGVRVRLSDGRTTLRPVGAGRVEVERTVELLIVPERAGTVSLGELRLPYWDPRAERYDVARVTLPSLVARGETLVQDAQNAAEEDPLRRLKPLLGALALRPYRSLLSRGPWAWSLSIAPMTLALAGLSAMRARRRWTERKSRERVEDDNDFLLLFSRANTLVSSQRDEAFGLASRALTRAERALGDDVPDETRAPLRDELERLREALSASRFAGESAAHSSDDLALFARVGAWLARLDEALR